MDFPVTRSLISALPAWVEQFTVRLPPPKKVTIASDGFRWRHETTDHQTLQVTKAVRIASGLRAAMVLADSGHTVETCVILRTVADFAAEIIFISEGVLEGRFTREQARFIEQHHAALPSTPDELAQRERDYYVGRKAIAKAYKRMVDKTGGGADGLARISAFLNKGYDSYVHGAYDTAMELFSGLGMNFMMKGTRSPRNACVAKVSVAGKLGEALNALRFMAMTWQMDPLAEELRAAFDELNSSREGAGEPCVGLQR